MLSNLFAAALPLLMSAAGVVKPIEGAFGLEFGAPVSLEILGASIAAPAPTLMGSSGRGRRDDSPRFVVRMNAIKGFAFARDCVNLCPTTKVLVLWRLASPQLRLPRA